MDSVYASEGEAEISTCQAEISQSEEIFYPDFGIPKCRAGCDLWQQVTANPGTRSSGASRNAPAKRPNANLDAIPWEAQFVSPQ